MPQEQRERVEQIFNLPCPSLWGLELSRKVAVPLKVHSSETEHGNWSMKILGFNGNSWDISATTATIFIGHSSFDALMILMTWPRKYAKTCAARCGSSTSWLCGWSVSGRWKLQTADCPKVHRFGLPDDGDVSFLITIWPIYDWDEHSYWSMLLFTRLLKTFDLGPDHWWPWWLSFAWNSAAQELCLKFFKGIHVDAIHFCRPRLKAGTPVVNARAVFRFND